MTPELSDAELLARVRAGDLSALGSLYERHHDAALRVARATSGDAHLAEDLVSAAFERVHRALARGAGPEDSFRAYLYTVIRRLAIEHGEASEKLRDTDDFSPYEAAFAIDDGAEASIEAQLVAKAFSALPERHQAVLWYLDVEGMTPQQAAPLFGLSPNATSALAVRARDALRDAYLQAHVSESVDRTACAPIRALLGAYERRRLSARDTAKVEAHLEHCEECPIVLAELHDVSHGLRVVLAPLLLGGVAAGVLASVGAGGGSAMAATAAAASPNLAGVASIFDKLQANAPVIGAGTAVAAMAGIAAVGVISASTREPLTEPRALVVAETPAVESPEPRPSAIPSPPAPAPEPAPAAPPPAPPEPAAPPPSPPPPEPPPPPPVPAAPLLGITFSLQTDLVLGDVGTVTVSVVNQADTPMSGSLAVTLPAGVEYDDRILRQALGLIDSLVSTGGITACASTSLSEVVCDVVAVLPGVSAAVEIPVRSAIGSNPGSTIANLSIE